MLKIYLARHGQDKDNANGIVNGHRNEPLTELGLAQAQALAVNIQKLGVTFDAVYSSPLVRAHKTAETVTQALHLPKPIVLPALIERDFGVMTGKPVKDIESLCAPNILKTNPITYFLSPEGAETFPQVLERARGVLELVKHSHTAGSVLLVTHGDFGKMLFAAYYGLDWKTALTQFHFGNSELLLLSEDTHAEEAYIYSTEQFNH
ncbi:MAG: histidine phosphatase family protein [Candidatus Liptonbacteria bacterium]|nr:histidine phosphatase family protein [Candidatus Liptonbacteria bacterium]